MLGVNIDNVQKCERESQDEQEVNPGIDAVCAAIPVHERVRAEKHQIFGRGARNSTQAGLLVSDTPKNKKKSTGHILGQSKKRVRSIQIPARTVQG